MKLTSFNYIFLLACLAFGCRNISDENNLPIANLNSTQAGKLVIDKVETDVIQLETTEESMSPSF